jgi:hypothetical protein
MLDGLIAELVDLGYDWNDDVPSEQTEIVADRSLTLSGLLQSADQVLGDTTTERLRCSDDFEPSGNIYDLEDSFDVDQSDNSNDFDGSKDSDDPDDWHPSDNSSESDESEECNFSDDSDVPSVEMFEEYGNSDTRHSKYILITKARTCRAPSPDMSVLVTIQDIS